jgi:hypothetical protein
MNSARVCALFAESFMSHGASVPMRLHLTVGKWPRKRSAFGRLFHPPVIPSGSTCNMTRVSVHMQPLRAA